MALGEKLKEIRKQKKLKQKYVAEQCEISTSYYCEIEKNKKSPTVHTLVLICNVLDKSIGKIIKECYEN